MAARTIYKGTSFEEGVRACAAILLEADRQREEAARISDSSSLQSSGNILSVDERSESDYSKEEWDNLPVDVRNHIKFRDKRDAGKRDPVSGW